LAGTKAKVAEQEVYSLQELIERFSLERVGKAGSIFTIDKLNWLEKQYIKTRPAEDIIRVIQPLLISELEKRNAS